MNKITYKYVYDAPISLHDRCISDINYELDSNNEIKLTLEFYDGIDVKIGDSWVRTVIGKVEFKEVFNSPESLLVKLCKFGYIEETYIDEEDNKEYVSTTLNIDDIVEYKILTLNKFDEVKEFLKEFEIEVIDTIFMHNGTLLRGLARKRNSECYDRINEIQVDIDIQHYEPNIDFYYE